MKYKVKVSYSAEFIFDTIEEAAAFFDQAVRHSVERYTYANIEPIYTEPDAAEEASDD